MKFILQLHETRTLQSCKSSVITNKKKNSIVWRHPWFIKKLVLLVFWISSKGENLLRNENFRNFYTVKSVLYWEELFVYLISLHFHHNSAKYHLLSLLYRWRKGISVIAREYTSNKLFQDQCPSHSTCGLFSCNLFFFLFSYNLKLCYNLTQT